MATQFPDNKPTATGDAIERAQRENQALRNQATGQTNAQQQVLHTPGQQPQNDGGWGLDNTFIEDPLVAASSSDALQAFETALATMRGKPGVIRLFGLDNAIETNWRYGAVIMGMIDASTKRVSFLPVVIEDTATSEIEGVNVRLANTDRTVTVIPLPNDAMTADYISRMAEIVAEGFAVSTEVVQYVPGILLPKMFNLTNVTALQNLLVRISKSCMDTLVDGRPSAGDMLNLSRLKGSGILSVRPTNNRQDIIDTVGLPVRQDFEVVLSSGRNSDQQQNGNEIKNAFQLHGAAQQEKRFGRLGAYIDFRMLPSVPQFSTNLDPRKLTRRFVPEVVIDGVDLMHTSTNAALMLMLSFAASVIDPQVYRGLLFQRQQTSSVLHAKSSFNPANLGALNIYAGFGAQGVPYDLQSSQVTPRDFMEYLDNILDEGIAVSVDVPRMGTQAAYLAVLSDCAAGKPDALQFTQRTLDQYTNGAFSRLMFGQGNEQRQLTAEDMFAEKLNSVFNGYYPAKIGDETRDIDIRHIDLCAVIANFGTRDKDMVTKYVQSFMVNHIDPYVRMSNRREVIEAYTHGSAVINSVSDRSTLAVRFLSVLAACNAENGFKPVLNYNNPLAGADTGLVAPGFMGGGVFTGAATQGYYGNNGGGNSGVGGSYVNNTAGRF